MRILLTNDDGFEAQGLRLLERVAAELGGEIWTIAPEQEQSGASRALTLTTPVRVRHRGARRFSVGGTPTDCIRIAVLDLLRDTPPDLILSGINRGQNVGEDIGLSGTVAAALQGAAFGIPSIALSQAIGSFGYGHEADWSASTVHAADLIGALLDGGHPAGAVFNINFPACRSDEVVGATATRQAFHEKSCAKVDRRTDPRGNTYYWMCFEEDLPPPNEQTDVGALQSGWISVTPLLRDLTDHETADRLRPLTLKPPGRREARA